MFATYIVNFICDVIGRSTSTPPSIDKGKGIVKPRKRRHNYVLRIPLRPTTSMSALHMSSLSFPTPPTGLHNPTSIPAIHMSSSSFQPPPTELHTPIAPTSPFVPPSHIPSSSSSVPHTGIHTSSANITASPSPHTIPSLASIGGPSPTVGEHGTPSLVPGDIVAPTSTGDPSDEDQDPPLHDRPMIELVGRG